MAPYDCHGEFTALAHVMVVLVPDLVIEHASRHDSVDVEASKSVSNIVYADMMGFNPIDPDNTSVEVS